MMIVSSFLSFPPISWWAGVLNADILLLDGMENYQKMSYRNRYRISGSNNPILLSVPLESGRNQRGAMSNIQIYNCERWQVQHWRTLVSVYSRTPYFEHYAVSLQALFERTYDRLVEFDRATIAWVRDELKLRFEMRETETYEKEYPAGIKDMRHVLPQISVPRYHQVFEDRIGFMQDLSILDLMFSKGPGTVPYLKVMGSASS